MYSASSPTLFMGNTASIVHPTQHWSPPPSVSSIVQATTSTFTGQSPAPIYRVLPNLYPESTPLPEGLLDGSDLFQPHFAISMPRVQTELSVMEPSTPLYLSKENAGQTLNDLHAILDIPEDQTWPLRLYHPSFHDFLLNKTRCDDPNFWVDEDQAHRTMADGCIRLMSTALKQDICDQRGPGVLIADVESVRVEECLPPEVQYACLYWVQHLQKCDYELHDNDQIHQFLKAHLLHWLEALSWMQKISEGILAIISLETIALVSLLTPCQAFFN
jgi:hypothetical protein